MQTITIDYTKMTDAELKAYIAGKLSNDNAWLRKGLLAIHARQTLSEQRSAETVDHNGEGFNSNDAYFLTQMANLVSANRILTQRQLDATRRKMMKYAGQLARITREKYPRAK